MFERFTDRARRVVVLAQEEARHLGHNWIGTEHLLLGLLSEGEGVAARVLSQIGAGIDDLRRSVIEATEPGSASPSSHIPFTRRAKKVLELSLREALALGHNYIGTEHILLGILRGDGVAGEVLAEHSFDRTSVRAAVIRELSGATDERSSEQSPPEPSPGPGWTKSDTTDDRIRALWKLLGGPTYKRQVAVWPTGHPAEGHGVRGVRIGDHIEIAGIGPIMDKMTPVPATAYHQVLACSENVFATLLDLNARPGHIVRITVYVVNSADVPEVHNALGDIFQSSDYAASVVVVSGLPHPEWKVMLDVRAQV